MSDLPPAWAIEKVKQLHRKEGGATVPMAHAFARYIAEHEPDPLLVEARAICAEHWRNRRSGDFADKVIAGECDHHSDVASALAALRRGIEIGKGDQ